MTRDDNSAAIVSQSTLDTRAIRKLLTELIRTDEDFDAFCLDHFPAVHVLFSSGMNRVQKMNLLLSHIDNPDLIARLLCESNPSSRSSTATYNHLAPTQRFSSVTSPRSFGRRHTLGLIGLGSAGGVAMVAYGLARHLLMREPAAVQSPGNLPKMKPRQFVMTEASLENLRGEALGICEKALTQSDPALRTQVMEGLGRTSDIRYGAQLIRIIRDDSDLNVRAQAALAIGRIGVRSQRSLLDTLRDKVAPELLAAVVEALYLLAEHQADLLELHKVLRQGLNSPVRLVMLRSAFLLAPLDPAVRELLWRLIEEHGPGAPAPADIGLLWRLCQSHFEPAERRIDQLLRNPNPEQAMATAVLVPSEGWPPALTRPPQWLRARSILAEASQVNGPTRLTAACALAQLGLRPAEVSVVNWLRELASAPDRSELVRRKAVAGLGWGGDAADLPLLAELFTEQVGRSLALRIEAAGAALRILSTLPSQLDEQALARAEEERLSGSGSALLQAVPSLKALEKVLGWLERGGRSEDAWLTNELLGRLHGRKFDTGQVRRRIDKWLSGQPKEGRAAHRIRAALVDDPQQLTSLLLDPDEQVRLWSAERLIRRGPVPHSVVQALQAIRSGPARIRAFGLLRLLDVPVTLPKDSLEAGLGSTISTDRQATVEALASWPLVDASTYLKQAAVDPDLGVRRRMLEVLENMIRYQPSALTAAPGLAAPLAQDADSGIQFRYQQVMGYVRSGVGGRPLPPVPFVPVLLPLRSVRVIFVGEPGVQFTINGQDEKLPLQLELAPGAYSLKWLDNENYVVRRILVPNSATHRVTIPVSLSHQKTPLL